MIFCLLPLILLNVYFCFVFVVEYITVQTKIVSNKSHKIASLWPTENWIWSIKSSEANPEDHNSVICSIFKTQKKILNFRTIIFLCLFPSRAWRCYCIEYFIRSERESRMWLWLIKWKNNFEFLKWAFFYLSLARMCVSSIHRQTRTLTNTTLLFTNNSAHCFPHRKWPRFIMWQLINVLNSVA